MDVLILLGVVFDYWFDKFTHIVCLYIVWRLFKIVELISKEILILVKEDFKQTEDSNDG